jgi:hypothetical protein
MELGFADDFEDDQFMLFEVQSEQQLADIMSGTVKLEFVSNGRDPIVVCTDSRTFQVLEFDTSNTLLLHDGETILSQHFSTFELRPRSAPFLGLRALLRSNAITEADIRSSAVQGGLSYCDVLSRTLCSRAEFDDMLRRLCAITVGGMVAAPRPELQRLIGNEIVQYAHTLRDWRLIDVAAFVDVLRIPLIEYPVMRDLVVAVLRSFAAESSDTHAILDERKVSRFVAADVLRDARNGTMAEDAFEAEMQLQLPTALKLKKEWLFGMFFSEDGRIVFVDEENLPIELTARIDALFRIHKRWETREMEPFFEFFVHDEDPFIDLISRHARMAGGGWMRR